MNFTDEEKEIIIKALINEIAFEQRKSTAYQDYAEEINKQLEIAIKQLKEVEATGDEGK